MKRASFLLSPTERPSWVSYPHSFCRLVEQGLVDITPWHILEGSQAVDRFKGLAERYPSRELFPFAFRQDNDDVACWVKGMGQKVFIVHDFASPGFEDEGVFDDVWYPLHEPVLPNRLLMGHLARHGKHRNVEKPHRRVALEWADGRGVQ